MRLEVDICHQHNRISLRSPCIAAISSYALVIFRLKFNPLKNIYAYRAKRISIINLLYASCWTIKRPCIFM